jgi:selenocysteine lyase/cysteine desulfurase
MNDQSVSAASRVDWQAVRRRFPAVENWVYLNTAGGGALSRDAARAATQHYADMLADADVPWPGWRERIEEIRGELAAFVGARSDEVAFVANAGLGMSYIAHLMGGEGSVLVPAGDFPAVTLPWLQLGYPVRFLESDDEGVISLDAVESALQSDTRVLATSFVQYASGFRQDIPALVALCRRHRVRLVVDATQGLGAFPVSFAEPGPDCMVFSSYKWLSAGYGVAGLLVRRELLDPKRLPAVGWRSARDPYRLLNQTLDIADEARALEVGHPPLASILVLGAAIGVLTEIGVEEIADRVLALTGYLRERAAERGLRLRSPGAPEHRSGITIIEVPRAEACQKFLRERGVCVTVRGGALRASVHFYNNEADIDRFMQTLDEFLP